jgi:hypothetical protein
MMKNPKRQVKQEEEGRSKNITTALQSTIKIPNSIKLNYNSLGV